ncbi:MAG: hypothetical protein ABL995_00820 [Bryobacteraceae bacterium]
MACPFFLPIHRIGPGPWDPAPRLPLGDTWAGECRAATVSFTPAESELREKCNTGYARGRCARFPESAPADAVRFSKSPSANDTVCFVFEKDHFPVEHGEIGTATEGRDLLNRQARAFLDGQARQAERQSS